MRKALLAALAFAVSGCASQAQVSVAADAATTAVTLSTVSGAVELNPLGFATVPIRLAVIEHAKKQKTEEAVPILHAVSAASWGAAANNLFVIGGATGAAPLALGIAIAAILWADGAHEREFWQVCAQERKRDPNITTCIYSRS